MWNRIALLAVAAATALPAMEPGYVDPAVCATCHLKAAEGYARSAMARSFGVAGQAPEGAFHHDRTQQDFTVTSRKGRSYLTRTVSGFADTYEAEMGYRIGSGEHAVSYVSRGANGKLLELPLTWYALDGGRWGMSPGYDLPFHAGFSRKITYGCLFCHAGYPDLPDTAEQTGAGWKMPQRLPEGIDCQRCHGPGAAHIDSARRGEAVAAVRSAIVNPARLDGRRGMDVCLQCHLETTSLRLPGSIVKYDRSLFSYRAGEPLADYILHFQSKEATGEHPVEFASQAWRLMQSACFLQSKGALGCTTCHNPHDVPRGAAATERYNAKCQTCHTPAAGAHVERGDCVSCHMPKRHPADAVNTIVSDHWIRKRPAPEATDVGVERNDSTVAAYRGEVAPFYPAAADALYLADAQVKDRANLATGIPLLESQLDTNPAANAQFYLDLAQAANRAEYARKATELMPGNWRAWLALGTIGDDIEALKKATQLGRDEPATWQALGEAHSRRAQFAEALIAFRAAIAADPEYAEAHNNMGTNLLRSGNTAEAEKHLREAVRLRPESAAMQANLASLLVRQNRIPEARQRYELALKLNPQYAEGHAAYGALLGQLNDWQGARAHLTRAVELNPQLPIAQNNLGIALLQTGDGAAALAHFNTAVGLNPTYYEAHLQLGLLLKKAGRKSEAEEHLRKALESPAPRVKQSAAQALNN